MTKTYDLVTFYYKGHSPLKKQDNSYLMCLYTMMFVLFAMVTILMCFTFYNVQPVENKKVYVHSEPQEQKGQIISTERQINVHKETKHHEVPKVSTMKPVSIPKAPSVNNYDDYEETVKPVINWDNVVDFLIGSEEDTSSKHPYSAPSQRTPGHPASNDNKQGMDTNPSTTVIHSTNENKQDQVPSVAPPIQQQTNQGSIFDEDIFRSTTELLEHPSVTSTPTKVSAYPVGDFNKSNGSTELPPVIHNKQELSTIAPSIPPESDFYTDITTNDSPKDAEGVSTNSTIIEADVKGATQNPSKSTPMEEDFEEWPDAATEESTKKNIDVDVEWVTIHQNLTSKKKAKHSKVQKDCKSARCEVAASKMISSINLSAEPCTNFYNFACSNVPPSRGNKEPELILDDSLPNLDFVKKFKWLYKSCLQHENYLNYRDRIQSTKRVLNSMEIFNFDQDQTATDITDVFASLTLLNAMPLFNVDMDVMNSNFILKLIPPDETLSSKYWSPLAETRKNCLRTTLPEYYPTIDITFLYYDYQKCQENRKSYLKSLETSMEELGNFGSLNNTQRKLHINDAIEFIRVSLLPIIDQSLDLQEKIVNLEYITVNIKNFQEQFPMIVWHRFFETITSNDLNITSKIQVYNKAYFERLFEKISLFEKDTLIKSLSAIATEKYYQELVLPTPKHSRAKYCSKLSNKLLPDISNYLNQRVEVNEDFDERKKYIRSLFDDLKQNFQNSLQDAEWLDETSKSSMLNKITNLEIEMLEDSLANESFLMEHYSKLDLKENDYSRNYHEATKFMRKTFLSLHGKPVGTEDVFRNFIDNFREEPKFFYGHNIVYVPDGLVHKTFLDYPKYLLMAKIGFPLAKVIGHALDPIGLKFGVDLSDNVSSIYDKFVDETRRSLPHHVVFNKLSLVFSLNSQLSKVERIAENTAMALVTKGIEEIQDQPLLPWVSYTFSREKIFFIALVQEFCTDMSLMEFVVQAHENAILPPQFSVQNILKNSEAFHDQFSCRAPSKINQLQFPYLSFLSPKEGDKIT